MSLQRLRSLVASPIGDAQSEANLYDDVLHLIQDGLEITTPEQMTRLVCSSGRPELARRVFNEAPRGFRLGLDPSSKVILEQQARRSPLMLEAVCQGRPEMLRVAMDLAPNHPALTGEANTDTVHGECIRLLTQRGMGARNVPGTLECAHILLDAGLPITCKGEVLNTPERLFFAYRWHLEHAPAIADLAREHHRRRPFDLETKLPHGLPPYESAVLADCDAAARLALELGYRPSIAKIDTWEREAPVDLRVRSAVAEWEMSVAIQHSASSSSTTTPRTRAASL